MNRFFFTQGNVKIALVVVLGVAVMAVVISMVISMVIFFGGQLLHNFFLGYNWTVYEDIANNFQISYPPDWKIDVRQGDGKKILLVLNPESSVAVALIIYTGSIPVTPEIIYDNFIKPYRENFTSVKQISFKKRFGWEVIAKEKTTDFKQLLVGFGTKLFLITHALNPEKYSEIITEVVDSFKIIK